MKKKKGLSHARTPFFYMVPRAGLEPARLAPLPPQDSVSTNSTTWAKNIIAGLTLLKSLEFLQSYQRPLHQLVAQEYQPHYQGHLQ